MNYQHTLDDIAECLEKSKNRERKCALLIGAGCSVTAGIPLASEFVTEIQTEYPRAYQRAQEKHNQEKPTYPQCMAQLSGDERNTLVIKYVDNAKINWAHIAIAELIKKGYVDRVLTTNFDPLVLRACALTNIFPSVYDFAASQDFEPDYINGNAIFHLHGQHSGFVKLHTENQVTQHSERLAPLFSDAGQGRTWIVAGYSGDNDPVFSQLATVKTFKHRLYWLGYQDEPANKTLQTELLNDETKDAHYISDYDADHFFVALATRLGCFPPQLFSDPKGHIQSILKGITEFHTSQSDSSIHPASHVIQTLNNQNEAITTDPLKTHMLFVMADYQAIINELLPQQQKLNDREQLDLAWAYIMQANKKLQLANKLSGEAQEKAYQTALEQYQHAVEIKPDEYYALHNWGLALIHLSYTQAEPEKSNTLTLAKEKCKKAFELSESNGSYNLACIYALQGQNDLAFEWLNTTKTAGALPSIGHLNTDTDLDNLRDDPRFDELLASVAADA